MGVSQNLTISLVSQNVANNTSTVRITLTSTQTGESHNYYDLTGYYWISVNGGAEERFSFVTELPYTSTVTCFTVDKTFTHKADGTGSISVRTSLDTGISAGVVELSKSLIPNTIPRASGITSFVAATKYLDSQYTIKFTPKTTGFYYRLRLSIPRVIAIRTTPLGNRGSSEQTINVTFTSTELNTIYSKASATSDLVAIGAVIETYSDAAYTKKIGESTEVVLSMTLPETIVPVINQVSITDPTNYKNVFGRFVQYKSKLKVQVNSTGVYNATIKNVIINCLGLTIQESQFESNALTVYGNQQIVITVTDSRGRKSVRNESIDIYSYATPTIGNLRSSRCNSDGTANDEGLYVKISYSGTIDTIGNHNTKRMTLKMKEQGSESWDVLFDSTDYYTRTAYIVTAADTEKTFDVLFTLNDYFETVERSIEISTAFTLMDFNSSGKGISFGKVSESDAFEVNMPSEFAKDSIIKEVLKSTYTNSNVADSKIRIIPHINFNVIDPTHTTDIYLENLIKWIASNYPKDKDTIYIGIGHPNYKGIVFAYTYDNSDISNGMPKNVVGLYMSATDFKRFYSSNYTFNIRNV